MNSNKMRWNLKKKKKRHFKNDKIASLIPLTKARGVQFQSYVERAETRPALTPVSGGRHGCQLSTDLWVERNN